MKVSNLTFNRIKNIRLKKKVASFGVLAILAMTVILVVIIDRHSGTTESCNNAARSSDVTTNKLRGEEAFKKAHDEINSGLSSCDFNGRITNRDQSNQQDKLNKLKLLHNQATTGYSLGKAEESKTDANEGLSLIGKLSESDKGSPEVQKIKRELEWVRDGTY